MVIVVMCLGMATITAERLFHSGEDGDKPLFARIYKVYNWIVYGASYLLEPTVSPMIGGALFLPYLGLATILFIIGEASYHGDYIVAFLYKAKAYIAE